MALTNFDVSKLCVVLNLITRIWNNCCLSCFFIKNSSIATLLSTRNTFCTYCLSVLLYQCKCYDKNNPYHYLMMI